MVRFRDGFVCFDGTDQGFLGHWLLLAFFFLALSIRYCMNSSSAFWSSGVSGLLPLVQTYMTDFGFSGMGLFISGTLGMCNLLIFVRVQHSTDVGVGFRGRGAALFPDMKGTQLRLQGDEVGNDWRVYIAL